MNTLVTGYRALKATPSPLYATETLEKIKGVIQVAYELAQSVQFRTAVQSVNHDEDIVRFEDTVVKIAQYYRATKQLVLAARKRRYQLFNRIQVHVFQIEVPNTVRLCTDPRSSPPLLRHLSDSLDRSKLLHKYQGSEARMGSASVSRLNSIRSGIKVHAEIKLLFFYEIFPETKRPRVIAANKSSCYLCNLFFQLHGVFQVPSTFGMSTERWILPDWCIVSESRREILRDTLVQFNEVLDAQISRTLTGRKGDPDPMQSIVALSASWSDPLDGTSVGHVTSSGLISLSSSFPSSRTFNLGELKAGEYIWKRLRSQSFSVHFYTSHVLLSFDLGNPEELPNNMVWARISLESFRNQLGYRHDAEVEDGRHVVYLNEIEEGAEKTLKLGVTESSIGFNVRWREFDMSVLYSSCRADAP